MLGAVEIVYRQVASDQERDTVNRFLAEHLTDPTAPPVPPRAVDQQLGIPTWAFVADAGGHVVGAAFASNCPDDVLELPAAGEIVRADIVRRRIVMLHQVAVDPEYRRQGIGGHLVELREAAARDAGARYDVAVIAHTATARQHLEHLGYQVGGPFQSLIFDFRPIHQTLELPISGSDVVWAVKALHPTTAMTVHFA